MKRLCYCSPEIGNSSPIKVGTLPILLFRFDRINLRLLLKKILCCVFVVMHVVAITDLLGRFPVQSTIPDGSSHLVEFELLNFSRECVYYAFYKFFFNKRFKAC